MAPAANVVYVGAPNNFQDLDAALNHVVDRHLAQIVTNSYGFPTEILPFGFIKRATERRQADALIIYPAVGRVDPKLLAMCMSAEKTGPTMRPIPRR